MTKEFIYSIVEDNEKKRYEVMTEDGIEYIRAAQGHTLTSVKTEELLTPI